MTYEEELFGDKIIFSKDEEELINKKLADKIYYENQEYDAKYIKEKITKNDEKERILIKPTVGFLNSIEGKGTILLGIFTGSGNKRFQKINLISEDVIKNEEQLENLITENIGSMPLVQNPSINVKKLSFNGGNIFIIKIKRNDSEQLYYSKLTQYVYKRYNNQTITPSLMESLKMLELKLNPKLSLSYKFSGNDKSKIQIILGLFNSGYKPGKYVACILEVIGTLDMKIDHSEGMELVNNTLPQYKVYQIVAGYPPTKLYVYPNVNNKVGTLTIDTNKNFDLKFRVKIYEESVYTLQEFRLIKEHPLLKIADEKISYKSYLEKE